MRGMRALAAASTTLSPLGLDERDYEPVAGEKDAAGEGVKVVVGGEGEDQVDQREREEKSPETSGKNASDKTKKKTVGFATVAARVNQDRKVPDLHLR